MQLGKKKSDENMKYKMYAPQIVDNISQLSESLKYELESLFTWPLPMMTCDDISTFPFRPYASEKSSSTKIKRQL